MIHFKKLSPSLKNALLPSSNAEEILLREQKLKTLKTSINTISETFAKKLKTQNKLSLQERINKLIDPNSPILHLHSLVHYNDNAPFTDKNIDGAGFVNAIISVNKRQLMLIASDPSRAAGAWWPLSPQKCQRAQKIALELRLPVIYLIETSGLYLPAQSQTFPNADGAGAIFAMSAKLSAAGIPQISAVFGPCIAGGAYMPIISDYLLMTENASILIGGSAIASGAKNQNLNPATTGSPSLHCHISNCADERFPNDKTAIARLRDIVSTLPSSANQYFQRHDPLQPAYPITELYNLIPENPSQTFNIEHLIARIADASLFAESRPNFGPEILTGLIHINGLALAIIANRCEHTNNPKCSLAASTLYRDGIQKMTQFASLCNDDGIPILWIQDVVGFDIGIEAEKDALLALGSNLIYQNTTTNTHNITLLLRKASGAGYYAMCGLPLQPTIQLSTVLTKQIVMSEKTIANATFNRKYQSAINQSPQNQNEIEKIQRNWQNLEEILSTQSQAVFSASKLNTDEIIELSEIRNTLSILLKAIYQSTGTFKRKNHRIWSINALFNN